MEIRPFEHADEDGVVQLWIECELVVPWNNPHRDIRRKLAVLPQHQLMGFATEMMDEAETLLRAAGCPKINLQVRSTNTEVIEFYRSLGYVIDDVASLGKRLDPDK